MFHASLVARQMCGTVPVWSEMSSGAAAGGRRREKREEILTEYKEEE